MMFLLVLSVCSVLRSRPKKKKKARKCCVVDDDDADDGVATAAGA